MSIRHKGSDGSGRQVPREAQRDQHPGGSPIINTRASYFDKSASLLIPGCCGVENEHFEMLWAGFAWPWTSSPVSRESKEGEEEIAQEGRSGRQEIDWWGTHTAGTVPCALAQISHCQNRAWVRVWSALESFFPSLSISWVLLPRSQELLVLLLFPTGPCRN